MSSVMERTLGILEALAANAEGLPLGALAERLNMPPSAAHRLLTDLCRYGYVRQPRDNGDYMLSTKLVAMALSFLNDSGMVDVVQPLLDQLAEATEEFVQVAIIDGERLSWVARAQGCRRGLRYDPPSGSDAHLSCSASGHAWLLTLSDADALTLVARQSFGQPSEFGPNAPTTPAALMDMLKVARKRGYSVCEEVYAPGLNTMAAPMRRSDGVVTGTISIAGPSVRLTAEKMNELGPVLLAAAREIGVACSASPLLGMTQMTGAPVRLAS